MHLSLLKMLQQNLVNDSLEIYHATHSYIKNKTGSTAEIRITFGINETRDFAIH